MFRLYLQLGIRSLLKKKFYTFLNVLGLGVGFLAFAMIMIYVRDEQSFDKFHEKSDRIVRIWDETTTRQVAIVPYIWGNYIKEEFAEVEEFVNVLQLNIIVKRGPILFNENNAFAVDSTFFDVFDFPVIGGDSRHMVDGTNQIVLTPPMVQKYFGSSDPIGQILEINLFGNIEPFQVTGVVDCPTNSHLQFDFLLPYPLVKKYSFNPTAYDNWSLHFVYSYLLLEEGVVPGDWTAKFEEFLFRHGGEKLQSAYDVGIEPLEDIYLKSKLEFDLTPRGNADYIRILQIVAVVILSIAIVNFINLSTAQSLKRAREVSVRKIFGSAKRSIIAQFLTESILISSAAMFIALLLFVLILPAFNDFTGKSFNHAHILSIEHLISSAVLAIITGVLAGLYPAMVISAFQPVKVLHSKASLSGRSSSARKTLVVFQFTMTVILLIGTGVIHQQVNYMRNKDLGFTSEQVIVIYDAGRVSSHPNQVKRLKRELANTGVITVSASSSPPGTQSWSTRYRPYGWEDQDEDNISLSTVFADFDYLKTYEIRLASGRDFDPQLHTDSINAFLINEAAQRLFASRDSSWSVNPIGKKLDWTWKEKPGYVIGVFKDYHFESLHRSINPLIIHVWPEYFFSIQMRIPTENSQGIIRAVEEKWSSLYPSIPFEYQFVDQSYEDYVASDRQLGQLFAVFSSLSILVAVLGLFGLSSFMAQDKAREMSIRKVIGATERHLTFLLTSKFLILVLIANLTAIPIAYFLMSQWLGDFANRIEMPLIIYITTSILTIVISLLTTSYHAFKTSRTNPVNVLGRE